jgi:hypothetical protein
MPKRMARQSRPIPGATTCHSVGMEACPACHDDIEHSPFARTVSDPGTRDYACGVLFLG